MFTRPVKTSFEMALTRTSSGICPGEGFIDFQEGGAKTEMECYATARPLLREHINF